MAVFSEEGAAKSIKCNKAIVTIGGVPTLALNVSITFQRRVEVVPTIGEDRVLSVGMPQGEIRIESLFGESELSNVLENDGCTPMSMSIKAIDECNTGNENEVNCSGVVISAATISAQGGRGYVVNGIVATFTKLEM